MKRRLMMNRGTGWRELRLIAVYFSATYFGVVVFFAAAMPSEDILATPPGLRLPVFLGHLVLTGALYSIDRLINYGVSENAARTFRAVLLGIFLALALRRFEYGWMLSHGNSDPISDLRPIVRALIHLVVFIGLMSLAFRFQRQLSSAFLYLFAVSVFLTISAPGRLAGDAMYGDYGTGPVTSESQEPPVIVVLFDELSLEALVDDRGTIDAERYPNFARLSSDSMAFSNATTNYFYTSFAVPPMIDAAAALAPERNVTIYEGAAIVERVFSTECGRTYTCRGAGYVSLRNRPSLRATMAARSIEAMIPVEFHAAFSPALDWVRDRGESTALAADPLGVHVHSNRMVDKLLEDLRAGDSAGRIYFFHTLVPHAPFVYAREGDTSSQPYSYSFSDPAEAQEDADLYAHYLAQVEYADTILGKILRTLEETGIYDKASLLVTGDHGLRKTGTAHGDPAADAFMTRVPLFIRAPGIERGWTSIDYQHIDFGRTLFDVAGVEFVDVPETGLAFEGASPVSAFATERLPRDKTFFMTEGNERYWKFVYNDESGAWTLAEHVEGPTGDRTEGEHSDG